MRKCVLGAQECPLYSTPFTTKIHKKDSIFSWYILLELKLQAVLFCDLRETERRQELHSWWIRLEWLYTRRVTKINKAKAYPVILFTTLMRKDATINSVINVGRSEALREPTKLVHGAGTSRLMIYLNSYLRRKKAAQNPATLRELRQETFQMRPCFQVLLQIAELIYSIYIGMNVIKNRLMFIEPAARRIFIITV